MNVGDERLAAAVRAFHSATGDAEKRVASILSAADDVARAVEVSGDAAVAAWEQFDPVHEIWNSVVAERCLRAALPFIETRVQVTDEMVKAANKAGWGRAFSGGCSTREMLEAALAAAPSVPPQPDARVQRLVEAATEALHDREHYIGFSALAEALAPFRQPAPGETVRKDSLHVPTPDLRDALVTAARAAELALLSGCTTYNGRPTWLYTAETFGALAKWLEPLS